MSSVIVNVDTGAGGFTAYAKQGPREHSSTATSPELAARLAAAELFQQPIDHVRAERKQPGVWHASVSGRRVS